MTTPPDTAPTSSPRLVSRKEWVGVLVTVLAALAVMSLPYLLGHTLARPGTFYTGTLMNPEDSQSYFAKMLQGYDGRWLYAIPFTSEAHQPAFLGGFYLLIGHLARVMGLSLVAAWHLSQLAAAAALLLTIFWFVARHLEDVQQRWVAFLLAVFGSGMGWLLFVLGQTYWLGAFPVDFKMPEAHPFFMAMTFPHASIGTALLLIVLLLLRPGNGGQEPSWRTGLAAGALNVVLGIVYPFLIYLVVAVVALYWLFGAARARRRLDSWPQLRLAAVYGLAFALPAPLYGYYVYVRQANLVFRAWDAQAITSSPPWPHYLVAFGPLLVLALSPLLVDWRRWLGAGKSAFLWFWVLAAAVLVYLPINPQRRFVQGIHVPLSILAVVGLYQVVLPALEATRTYQWLLGRPRYSVPGLRRLFLIAFLGFMALSNLYVLADVSLNVSAGQPYPFFRQEEEREAVDWLRAETPRAAVVLGAYETGNYVAAHAGNQVVIGHWAETVDWQTKLDLTSRFYSGLESSSWMQRFLRDQQVDYIWYGPRERGLGSPDLERLANVSRVYYNDLVTLYAVN